MIDRHQLGYRVPFVVMLLLGLFFIAQYYIPHPSFAQPKALVMQWKQPLGGFIMFVAILGLASVHLRRVVRRERRWGYSLVTLGSMGAMIFVGMAYGIQEGTTFSTWFKFLISPIEATMFSLLAFFIASAAFRAFRARSAGATVLLVSGIVVMLGFIPPVEAQFPVIRDLADFLLKYPNTAAKRAIMIGVALGAISVSLKTILGIDRTVLGKSAKG